MSPDPARTWLAIAVLIADLAIAGVLVALVGQPVLVCASVAVLYLMSLRAILRPWSISRR
jgi:hypothetical protein